MRIRNAAPLRQRFSLDVSSSKKWPRRSPPRTFMGRCTAILRSARCRETSDAIGGMGKILLNTPGAAIPKETLHALENFAGRSRRLHFLSQFAAVQIGRASCRERV